MLLTCETTFSCCGTNRDEWGLCNWFRAAVPWLDKARSWAFRCPLRPEVGSRGLGLWVWACVEQIEGMEMGGTDLAWPQPWEMSLRLGSCLWPHSSPFPTGALPPLLRNGALCLAQWSSHNIHWSPRSQERCLRVHFEASGGLGVVFKQTRLLGSPTPQPLV